MNKKHLLLILLLLMLGICVIIFANVASDINNPPSYTVLEKKSDDVIEEVKKVVEDKANTEDDAVLSAPLDRIEERLSQKKFGDFITPRNSPVQPERFSGYHTGVDLEVFDDEENKSVFVKALCTGELLVKRTASGYGGLLVQRCTMQNEEVTVIYGHMAVHSNSKKIGEIVKQGEVLGALGEGESAETDFERKHLHLGIHRGADINIKGYVQNKDDLNNWRDPCDDICAKDF